MKRIMWFRQSIAMLVLVTVGAGAQTGAALSGSDLQAQVATIAAGHHGKVALWARDLKTGEEVALDADKPLQTASVIKLAILYDAMVDVREGRARWDEPIVMKPGDGVMGSGVLGLMDAPMTLTLKDVLTLMVIVSDNTATNLMIDRFTVKAVNDRVAALGLVNTHLYKKIGKPATEAMPADQPKFGLGKSTAREMGRLMEMIGRCELHQTGLKQGVPEFALMDEQDAAVCKVGLGMLRNQFYRTTVPRYLEPVDSSEEGSAVASKTGSLNAVRADVAIVTGKNGPMVISAFTYENADHSWTVDNEGEVTVAKLAKAVVGAWSPEGLSAKAMVPGLGISAGK